MLFPIQKLIANRDAPQCVAQNTKIAEALALMVQHDYSQLPIVDAQNRLVGLISDQSIVEMYYHSGGTIPLLDLPVTHCQISATTLSAESDIFDALEQLKNHSAIVILNEQKQVVGILTDYDATHFLRDISEGIIQVEDIEVTLRQYIEAVFPDATLLQTAIKRALGTKKDDSDTPAYDYEDLTFYQQMQLIRHPANWPRFKEFFAPLDLFWTLMDQVREIRNQLMHFRGQLDPMQDRVLVRARDWLASRPKPPAAKPQTVHVTTAELPVQSTTGKYTMLETWLVKHREDSRAIEVSLDEIESLLNRELPPSAREHRSWWANDPTTHPQAQAWMRAGWRIEDVDLKEGKVVFKRTDVVLQQLFLDDILTRLKEVRPSLTRVQKALPQSWLSFGAGRSGFAFGWNVASGIVWVELYIDVGDKDTNKRYFDALQVQKHEIEAAIGAGLTWQRLDKKQASRILLKHPDVKISTYPPEDLEQAKQWAVDTMLKFVDVFQPRIKEL